jgi:hypothetical protein
MDPISHVLLAATCLMRASVSIVEDLGFCVPNIVPGMPHVFSPCSCFTDTPVDATLASCTAVGCRVRHCGEWRGQSCLGPANIRGVFCAFVPCSYNCHMNSESNHKCHRSWIRSFIPAFPRYSFPWNNCPMAEWAVFVEPCKPLV